MNMPRIIIDAVLFCPHCGANHVDEERNGEKWHRRAHTTHRCQACDLDFDVYVSGQASSSVPGKAEHNSVPGKAEHKPDAGTPKEAIQIIKEALEQVGIHGVTVTSGSDLEFPLGGWGYRFRKMTVKVSE